VTKEEYSRVGSEALIQQLAGQLRGQGRRPYAIPVGGSSAVGTWGYLQAVEELLEQVGPAWGHLLRGPAVGELSEWGDG
jgi:1-aminocyclopropane-1-carboxylate deaminase/D-cysteine desulfhydrase-like pyridoxal-dependent ACC family enzyme